MTFSDRIPVDSSKAGITFEKALNSLRADGPGLAIFLQSSVTGCSEPKPYKKDRTGIQVSGSWPLPQSCSGTSTEST